VSRPIAVIGPTGTGKSGLGLQLAERLGGEILNADAMQQYRGMDIGTAKVPATQRRGVPHHQLDVLEVTDTATVARYQQAAVTAVEEITARGAVPIIVGGSMMYVQALLDQWAFPATDPAVRSRLELRLAEEGTAALHAELARFDPAAATTILASDGRRIVRALEVIELTGKPFAASAPRIGAPRWNTAIAGSPTARISCSTPGWSTKCASCWPRGCVTVSLPPVRWGMRRCLRHSTPGEGTIISPGPGN
jgi:tRNA dimethylallyltransferase